MNSEFPDTNRAVQGNLLFDRSKMAAVSASTKNLGSLGPVRSSERV